MAFVTGSPPLVAEALATQPVRDSGAQPLNVATSDEVGAEPLTQLPAVDHTPLPPAQTTDAPRAGVATMIPANAITTATAERPQMRWATHDDAITKTSVFQSSLIEMRVSP
jgi:hypothetical protein